MKDAECSDDFFYETLLSLQNKITFKGHILSELNVRLKISLIDVYDKDGNAIIEQYVNCDEETNKMNVH